MDRKGMTVCHECLSILRQPLRPRRPRIPDFNARQSAARTISTLPAIQQRFNERQTRRPSAQSTRTFSQTPLRRNVGGAKNLTSTHGRIVELAATALKPEKRELPSEQRVLYVLEQFDAIARELVDAKTVAGAKAARDEKDSGTATSALLGSVNTRQHPAFLSKASLLNLISEKAEEILRHPSVFITPAILKSYVNLQAELYQPSSFPDIFHLYATKPAPKLTTNGHIIFTPTNAQNVNAAIDPKTASAALASAITAHNLPLCIDIIDTSFATSPFRRYKSFRSGLIPFGGLIISPAAAYSLSLAYAHLAPTMDPVLATGVAFAGIMTYVFTITGLGYVVITTTNDQMERVTWAKGVPLWERWMREEERAALDKVAGAWGFKDSRWRGTEEGVEWEELRETIGRRGMCLDRVELMEGME